MIVGLVGEAVVITEDLHPLIPPLFLSPTIPAGMEEMYGVLRGRLPARLVALLKIRDYRFDDTVRQVAGVQMLTPVNSGRRSDQHGLVTVQMREDARGFTIVDIGTILGLAHLIQEEDQRWVINSRIDLSTFNEVY